MFNFVSDFENLSVSDFKTKLMPIYSKVLGKQTFLPNSEQYEREKYKAAFHDPLPIKTRLLRFIPGLILVPLRCIVFIIILIPASVLISLTMVHHKAGKPLKGIRKVVLTVVLKVSARLLLFTTGCVWITVKGKPPRQERHLNPPLIANHQTASDILLMICLGGFSFIAKKEVLNVKLVGPVSKALGCLYVDRSDPDSASRTAEQLGERLRDGRHFPLAVFPEGATGNGTAMLRFKTGVFRQGTPVKPIVFSYSDRSVVWDTQPWYFFIITILSCPFYTAHVQFLPLYFPSEEEKQDPVLYASNVQEEIAKAGNLEITSLTSHEKVEYEKYCNGKGPLPAGMQRRWHQQSSGNNICYIFKNTSNNVRLHYVLNFTLRKLVKRLFRHFHFPNGINTAPNRDALGLLLCLSSQTKESLCLLKFTNINKPQTKFCIQLTKLISRRHQHLQWSHWKIHFLDQIVFLLKKIPFLKCLYLLSSSQSLLSTSLKDH